ncbi:MAG: hypothetical protein ACXWQE_10855, partial [Bdellovibrionales bacterium]
MRYCLTHILFMGFSLPFMCVGCLGDFKSNSASSTNYQITGRASAGPIKDATVTVYLLNSAGAHARVLATGTTDSKGNFSLQYEPSKITLSQTVIEVGITGGNFTEEASGATTSFGLYQMRSRLTVATDAIVSAVTPLTEIATARADALMAGG